jgi:hypothetical protein
MTNDFSTIPAESNLRDEITVRSDEFDPVANPAYDGPMGVMTDYDGCETNGLTHDEWIENVTGMSDSDSKELDASDKAEKADELEMLRTAGWPGDGSGEDDLADYNANEADDYRDE